MFLLTINMHAIMVQTMFNELQFFRSSMTFLNAQSTCHLRSAEQGLLHVPFARTSAMQARPSPWLALWYGMVSHWLSSHFLEYSPRNSFSNLKQHYLAMLGLGALLSSPT